MAELGHRTLTVIKGSYLVGFFALTAGIFYPIITRTSFDSTVWGILILFFDLFGCYLVYRSAISKKFIKSLFITGMSIIGISVLLVLNLAGAI